MAVYEDAMFVKALKLLNSPAKDSTLQMMHLLEEVIDQKYGVGTKTLNIKLHNLVEEPPVLDFGKSRGSRGGSPAVVVLSEKSSRSSTPPSEPVSIRTSPDRDGDADGDLALEIFEDDLFCTVCKGIRVTSDNRLLECNDCHSLYHQECHNPPIDSDANDPSVVWICGDCSKSKQEKPQKSKSSESTRKHKSDTDDFGEYSGNKRDPDMDPPAKKEKSERSSHKKSEKSSGSGSSSSSSSKHGTSKSSSRSEHRSSSSSSSKSSGSNLNFNKQPGSPNSKTPSCTANIIAADKRLQNMKKKAAAKMNEKRK